MFVLFFAVWILLNGRVSLEVVLFGLVITAALYIFCCRFMHYGLKRDWDTVRRLPRLLVLFAVLLREIVKSCLALLPFIYTKKEPDSVVARFTTDRVKTETGRVLLANCITMTPGTITGSLKDGEYRVHCLDRSMGQGLDSSCFVEKLEKWEEM